MKTRVVAAIAILSCGIASAEQHSATHEAILAQEKAWASALVASDLPEVDSIMHRDFRLVRAYSDAPPISKEAYLSMEGMSASMAEVTSVALISETGPIVVARVTWSMDWAQEGVGKLPPHFDMIDTWMKGKDGVWKVLSRVSQIADGPYRSQ